MPLISIEFNKSSAGLTVSKWVAKSLAPKHKPVQPETLLYPFPISLFVNKSRYNNNHE